MYRDAMNMILSRLPVLTHLICKSIPFEPGGILPEYSRVAWRFGPKDGIHVVVIVNGRSAIPGDSCYLSHIAWRKGDECVFHVFQANLDEDAGLANMEIAAYTGVPPEAKKSYSTSSRNDNGCVITKAPDRVKFVCKCCGCEFIMPADRCRHNTATGCRGKSDSRTYVWLLTVCPCCNAKCSTVFNQESTSFQTDAPTDD